MGAEMPALLRAEEWDVNERLNELGLTRDLLLEIVQACVAARGGCTDNDPPAAGGWDAWRMGTRRAREKLRPLNWDKDETGGLSTVKSDEHEMRIAILNTDDATGLRARAPTNSSKKGVATERAVDLNGELFPDTAPTIDAPCGHPIWYLCVHVSGDDVRAELSFPERFHNGFIAAWIERILLLEPGQWDKISIAAPTDDSGPDLEIEVRRK